MVHSEEAIPNPFDFAQGSAALEAATLSGRETAGMRNYTLQGSKFPRVRSQTVIAKPLPRAKTGILNREHYIFRRHLPAGY